MLDSLPGKVYTCSVSCTGGMYLKKIVLFDLDGTTLDTLEDLRSAVNAALRACGFPERSSAEMLGFVGRGVRAMLEDAMPPYAKDADIARGFEVFTGEYEKNMDVRTRAYPGVCSLVDRLHEAGIRACVISNKYDSAVRRLVEKHLPQMDGCIGTFEDMPKKPAPDTALRLLKELGFAREDGIYVGDSYVDIQTAGNLGMPFIGVSWGFSTREQLLMAGAQAIAADTDELYGLLLPYFR